MNKPSSSENPPQIGVLEKIRNLKYTYSNVEYDEDTNKYHLIQKKNTIESLETPYSNEVVSYVFGAFESKGKTKKMSKKDTKNKTRKLRIEEDLSIEEAITEPSKMPIIGEDGSITWKDENYKKVWEKLSPKHKELLANDSEWLQESMESYAKNNSESKTLKFIYPKNIIFPPRKMEDGSYDFGNEIYNEVININKRLMTEYLKDLDRADITKEKADFWFKQRLEEKVYDFLYPIRSKLVAR
jgi:hypothetical protein